LKKTENTIEKSARIMYNDKVENMIFIGGILKMLNFLTNANNTPNTLSSLLPLGMLVLMFVAMYFLTIRPQKKAEKEANDMRNNLEIGDEITTIGGIVGKIVSIKEETCVIETSKNGTKIRILKQAVRNVDVKAQDAQ
jgi:preprotein translocase subunit YajC